MLHVCLLLASIVQNIKCNLLSLITSASDLALSTIKFCSVPFSFEVVYAGCDKQDSLMPGGLCGKRTSTLTAINTI